MSTPRYAAGYARPPGSAPLDALLPLLLLGLLAIPLPAAETTPPAPAAVTPADQPRPMDVLVPGDLVQVDVYSHPDLTVGVRVPIQGPVSFPLVGAVERLAGRTTEDLANELKRRLEADYLHHASVTVTVREYARRKAFVMGSVTKPSAIELSPIERTTALRAISECGGFLPEADRKGIRVLRQQGDVTLVLPLSADIAPNGLPQDLVLLPDDLIVVAQLDRIYVLGQVNRPGAVPIPTEEALTLSKALSLAGGFDRYARESEVQLLRGGEAAKTIDVGRILAGAKGAEDPALKPGDTVYVPTRRY